MSQRVNSPDPVCRFVLSTALSLILLLGTLPSLGNAAHNTASASVFTQKITDKQAVFTQVHHSIIGQSQSLAAYDTDISGITLFPSGKLGLKMSFRQLLKSSGHILHIDSSQSIRIIIFPFHTFS